MQETAVRKECERSDITLLPRSTGGAAHANRRLRHLDRRWRRRERDVPTRPPRTRVLARRDVVPDIQTRRPFFSTRAEWGFHL